MSHRFTENDCLEQGGAAYARFDEKKGTVIECVYPDGHVREIRPKYYPFPIEGSNHRIFLEALHTSPK